MKNTVILLFIITAASSCEKKVTLKLKDQTVLWGIVSTGNSPYFEFWQNSGNSSLKLDPNDFQFYMEDLSDSSHKLFYLINGLCQDLIIKANTEYRIVWKRKNSNQFHSFVKQSPPAFNKNILLNISREATQTKCSLDMGKNTNYNVAILRKYWKTVTISANVHQALTLLPKAETIIPLQNYSDEVVLWPTKFLSSTSYTGMCTKYVDGPFRNSNDLALCIISIDDESVLRVLSEQIVNYKSPSLVGEKIPVDYENGNVKAIVPFVSFDNNSAFYDYIPKKGQQTLTVLNQVGQNLDTSKFEIDGLILPAKNGSHIFFGSEEWAKHKSNNSVFLNRDDLMQIFSCDYDFSKSFQFDLILNIRNKSNLEIKEYRYNDLIYEDRDKTHTVQLY